MGEKAPMLRLEKRVSEIDSKQVSYTLCCIGILAI